MFNAAMLVGALLLCAPWAKAQGKVTLTVKVAAELTDVTVTAPANGTSGEVDANTEVTVTLSREPKADHHFEFDGVTAETAVVAPVDGDKKSFKVTVKKTVELTVKEVANAPAAKVTLTVTIAEDITPELKATLTPEDGKVEAGQKVEIKFNRAAGEGKEFKFDGAEVTAKGEDGMTFEVTVNADVTVKVTEEAKAAPQPETPKFDITSSLNGATVEVKDGENVLDQEALKNIEAGKNLIIKVTVPEGKELVKVEIKKGEELTTLNAEADGSYKYTTTADAVVLVVTTKEKEAPAPAGPGFTVVANGATVKVFVNGKEVKAADYNKIAAGSKLEITITPAAKKAIDKVTVKAEGDAKETELKPNKNGKYEYTLAKKSTLTVKVKDATPVEDAVLAAVSVYPNPFVGQLVVANTAEVAKVVLVNAQGVVVRTVLPNGANELRLAVEDLPAGVYVLVLERADARKAIRLVK